MIQYEQGQRVQFNVEFSNKDTFIPVGCPGIIKSAIAGDAVFVKARGSIWWCYWFEVRPDGTEITSEMQRMITAHEKLLADYANWEAGSISA